MQIWTKWTFLAQMILNVHGFSPYFHIELTPMTYADSVTFCKSKGMELVTITNPDTNTMAKDFLLAENVVDKVWISLTCPSLICSWPDGTALSWSAWITQPEPVDECVYFDDILGGFWKTGKCSDLYLPLCYAPPMPGFELITGSFDFYEASVACYSIGGQLAILNNPVAAVIAKDVIANPQLTDIWIGLYGNGTTLVWQNVKTGLTFTDWTPGTVIPDHTANVAVAMDSSLFTWKGRPKTDKLSHVLCQYNYMVVGSSNNYDTARQGCTMYALDLATLSTEEEFYVALNAISYSGVLTSDFWIGLISDGTTFTWIDGTPLTYSPWVPEAPAPDIGFWYGEMDYSRGYSWNNRPASEGNGYLCKFPTKNVYPISQDIQEDFTVRIPQDYFVKDKIDFIPNISPFLVDQVSNAIECASKCLKSETTCDAVSVKDKTCSLYSGYTSNDVTANVDSTIWIKVV